MVTKALTPTVTITDKNKNITAKVVLHHYRFPRDKVHVSGEFAIVFVEIKELLSGDIPDACFDHKDCICIRGKMPRLEEGMDFFFQGSLVFDPKWGYQYNVSVMRLAYDLSSEDSQRKFFSFFLTEKQIDTLFSSFENPVKLLEDRDLEALTSVKGIGPVTAQRLCAKYEENIENGRAYIELQGLGLTKTALDRLILEFKSPDVVVDLIKENPYRLISLVRGYGWVRTDTIARKQGFTTNCIERVIAFAQYKLYVKGQEGHSCTNADELVAEIVKECAPIDTKTVVEYLKTTLAMDDEFKDLYKRLVEGEKDIKLPLFYFNTAKHQIGTFHYRMLEEQIKDELVRLKTAPSLIKYDRDVCEKIIQRVEEEQGYKYTHEQRKAIWGVLNNNVSIITGCAGSGKSSTLKPLVEIFKYYGSHVAQCALSGRAASLLTEYTKINGKTIHRLLKYIPETGRFQFTKDSKLPLDVILLDEVSMIGEELFYALISAMLSGAKLVMLGDTKQLPPIDVGNLLHDCIKSAYIPTYILTIIQRQAQRSGIVTQSLSVCEGHNMVKGDFVGEEIRGELKDFKVICHSEAMLVHAKAIKEFQRLYAEGIDPDDIQLVVPMRVRGQNSCRMFNAEIQQIVNGGDRPSIDVNCVDGDIKYVVTYKVGDRIMIIHNNYHARTISGKETAIFNGNMGHITEVHNDLMIIQLDDRDEEEGNMIILPRNEWTDITHSWCSTCHKLQGSQAKYVIIVVDNASYTLLIREWLYTAITRARKYCVLVGQPAAINLAVHNSDIKVKQTWLKDELYNKFLQDQGVSI